MTYKAYEGTTRKYLGKYIIDLKIQTCTHYFIIYIKKNFTNFVEIKSLKFSHVIKKHPQPVPTQNFTYF